MQKNLKLLESLLEETLKDYERMEKLIERLIALTASPQYDIEKAEQLIEMINHYEQIIRKKLQVFFNHINKYILNEIHTIYAEDIRKGTQIQRYDNLARTLGAKATVISGNLQGQEKRLQEIARKVSIRKAKPFRNARPIGF